jgi:hypothetical protein
VQGRHDRLAKLGQEGEQVSPVTPPVDAKFVLDRHEVHVAVVDLFRGANVVLPNALADLESHYVLIVVGAGGVGHGQHPNRHVVADAGDSLTQIASERCDATLAGWVGAEEGQPQWVVSNGRSTPRPRIGP